MTTDQNIKEQLNEFDKEFDKSLNLICRSIEDNNKMLIYKGLNQIKFQVNSLKMHIKSKLGII